MALRNSENSYGWMAKTLHWLTFVLIASLLAVGFLMGELDKGDFRAQVYGLHKSFGIMVLIVASIRLMWMYANVTPLLPASMREVEKLAANLGHSVLYLLMFAMPLSGWGMSSAAGFPVSVFGLFTMPMLVDKNEVMRHFMKETHEVLAWTIIVVVSLHIAAALYHHFVRKDNVLTRMLPSK